MTDLVFASITDNLFHGCEKWVDENVAYFCDVLGNELNNLVESGVLKEDSRAVYYGPTVKEFLNFLNTHLTFTCHGQVKLRDEEPIIKVEGLYCGAGYSNSDIDDFLKFSMSSDVLRNEEIFLYSRWN